MSGIFSNDGNHIVKMIYKESRLNYAPALGVETIPLITTPLIISSLRTVNFSEEEAEDSMPRDSLCSPFSSSPPGLVVMLEVDSEEVKGKFVMTE